ncbi:MAG: DNA polymerase III subunit delta [Eubacterium sp.]|nr:DNA polymerase III subunit delta [Eubacterium sp.]
MAEYNKKQKNNPTNESMKRIKSDIEAGSFARVYLLFGEERYLVNQYRDMLVNALVPEGDTMNFTSYTADSFNEDSIRGDMVTMPFLSEHRTILVENSGIFDLSEESILSSISEMADSNVLIFCEIKVDKRKKPYSLLSKAENTACLEFLSPSMDTLSTWVAGILGEGGIKVRMTVPEKLISTVGSDMNVLKNEATKLHDFCMEKGEINDSDVDLICVNPVEDKIFDMCEAISRKDSKKAITLYNDLCILKTKPMTVIYLVSRQFNILNQVKELVNEGADYVRVMKYLKTYDSYARKYISIVNNYSQAELIAALDKCQQADLDIKRGRLTEVNAAENLIVTLLK